MIFVWVLRLHNFNALFNILFGFIQALSHTSLTLTDRGNIEKQTGSKPTNKYMFTRLLFVLWGSL